MFKNFNEVPDVIKSCYYEDIVSEPTGNLVDQEVKYINEEGIEETTTIQVPEMHDVTYLRKYPAYYEDGGHISRDTCCAWDFHDSYIDWMSREPSKEDFTSNSTEMTKDVIFDEESYNAAMTYWQSQEPQKHDLDML